MSPSTPTPLLALDDVLAARSVVAAHLAPTPTITHPLLSAAVGCEVWVKLENAQPLGAFKVRGGISLVARLAEPARRAGICAATRGNHGQALAWAARLHGVRCVLFVPEGNNPHKNAAMAALGAEVIVAGTSFDAAAECAAAFAHERGALEIHPGKALHLLAGAGTIALEMLEQVPAPLDAVFVPVGVGSCAAGVGTVFRALSPDTAVIGVAAARAPATYHAFRSGELRACPAQPTVADGLAVGVPIADTLAVMRSCVRNMLLVEEAEIYRAIRLYTETIHQLAEGAGAAALAGAVRIAREHGHRRIGVVLSGANIDAETLRSVVAA